MGVRLKLFGIGLGIAAALWGWRERTLAAKTGDDAVKLTCKALGASGPGENAHVEMTDFLLAPNFVYQTGKHGSKWSAVWVPAVPLDGEYALRVRDAILKAGKEKVESVPAPRPVTVIVKSTSVEDEQALNALGEKDVLEGLVVNSIETLDGEERGLLERTYGDVSKAQILEVGRSRTSPWLAVGGLVGGAILTLGSVGALFRRKKA